MNVVLSGFTVLLWIAQKNYYKYRNSQNAKRWAGMDEVERHQEEVLAEKLGNKSVTYQFST